MKFDEWNKLRGKLNHDWLQNRYLTFLKAWILSCSDTARCSSENMEEISDQLGQWLQKRDLFVALIRNTENALSPRQLFESRPLCDMADDKKEWLGNLVHNLFISRTSIRHKIELLESMLLEVDKSVDLAVQAFGKGDNNYKLGENLNQSAMKLSRAITDLPRSIQVI